MNSPVPSKLSPKSKKLSKVRRNRAKKSRNPTKSLRNSLQTRGKSQSFFGSEHCDDELVAFKHLARFPACLRTNFKEIAQVFRAIAAFKRLEGEDFRGDSQEFANVRFLAQSQEDFVERLLRKKYDFTRNSENLQEICCYVSAKELLKSQFREFFGKRREFFGQNASFRENFKENDESFLENCQESLGKEPNLQEIAKKDENFEENSFSTANVSSPSMQNLANLAFFKENPQNLAKDCRGIFSFEEDDELNLRFFRFFSRFSGLFVDIARISRKNSQFPMISTSFPRKTTTNTGKTRGISRKYRKIWRFPRKRRRNTSKN